MSARAFQRVFTCKIWPRYSRERAYLILINFGKFCKHFGKILTKNEITELCKGVHCVDLGESFQTHIFLQNLASIQPRTSPVKFARPLVMQQLTEPAGLLLAN